MAVPAEAAGGPLSLRCGFGVWIDAGELDPEMRVGVLKPPILDQTRQKWQQLEAGPLVGSELEQGVDADPEYGYWREEVLEPARAALSARRSAPASGEVLAFPSRPRWSSVHSAFGLAASVLLAVSLGLSGGLLWQIRSSDQKLAALEKGYDDLGRDKEQTERELQRRIADLEAQVSGGVDFDALFNQPLVAFHAGDAVRGQTKEVVVPHGTRLLRLVLAVEELETPYRLEISRRATGEEIWSRSWPSDELGDLSVTLPASRLPAGDYRLRLYPVGEGRDEWVGEYRLSIASEKK